jgi:hypothetical protein
MTGEQPAEEPNAIPSGVARDLRALRRQWEHAYIFTVRRGSRWLATRVDDGGLVEADSAAALREKVEADYDARPVVSPKQHT